MIQGIGHPYREHAKHGGYTVFVTQEFAAHCMNAVRAVGERDRMVIGELKVSLKAVEAAFLRGVSGYDLKSGRIVEKQLNGQYKRIKQNMYSKYISKNDANKTRYLESQAAMSEMKTLHEKSSDLLSMAANTKFPAHIRAVQIEMCWHILDLCEKGTNVVVEAYK